MELTAPQVTLAASAAALPPAAQPARQPPPSLSLGSLGDSSHIFQRQVNSELENELLVTLPLINNATNKHALASLLDELAKVPKPAGTDLSPIFRLLGDSRCLVRHSAIGALKNTDSPEVEDRLLSLLQTTSDPCDLIYVHSVLNQVGTSKSIPALSESLKSRKRDVKLSAQAAITAIETRIKGHDKG